MASPKGYSFKSNFNELMNETVKQNNGDLEMTVSDHVIWAVLVC